MSWYKNIKTAIVETEMEESKKFDTFIGRLNHIKSIDPSNAITSDHHKFMKMNRMKHLHKLLMDFTRIINGKDISSISMKYIQGDSLTDKENTYLSIPRETDGSLSDNVLLTIIKNMPGSQGSKEQWDSLPKEDVDRSKELFMRDWGEGGLDKLYQWLHMDTVTSEEGKSIRRAREWDGTQPGRLRKNYGKELEEKKVLPSKMIAGPLRPMRFASSKEYIKTSATI